MQNIEYKAELRHFDAARQQCKAIGASSIGTLRQTDTYFKLADGRLKRREAPGEPTEWIFYHRANDVRPRVSHYAILTDDQARRRWGSHNLKPWVTVVKTRELWMADDVRIHLDQVDGLGCFIEFEAIVSERQSAEDAQRAVTRLREAFGPVIGEPVSVSYSDLMDQQTRPA